jgi:hypothetical protein
MASALIDPVGKDTAPLVTVSPLEERILPRTSSLKEALGEAVPIPTDPEKPNEALLPLASQILLPSMSRYCGLISPFLTPSEGQ